jgi:hypothetical protein
VQDLSYLLDHLKTSQGPRRSSRFSELNERICELVEDFGLVSFETLAIEDKRSMLRLQRVLDKATGYVYVEKKTDAGMHGQSEGGKVNGSKRGTAASADALFTVADRGVPLGWGSAADVQERWIDHRDDWEDFEIKERNEMEERWSQANDSAADKPPKDTSLGGVKERVG